MAVVCFSAGSPSATIGGGDVITTVGAGFTHVARLIEARARVAVPSTGPTSLVAARGRQVGVTHL
jgi:hypothetical protein